jgi:hypothetical protein
MAAMRGLQKLKFLNTGSNLAFSALILRGSHFANQFAPSAHSG